MSDKTSVGVYVSDDVIEKLDDLKREWDRREQHSVNRSTVANQALPLGLAALEIIDEENPHMDFREKRHLVRQAMLDHFRAPEG